MGAVNIAPNTPPHRPKCNGAAGSEDLTVDALPEEAAIAPLENLLVEALASPDEFGGALAPSPTAFMIRKPARDEWFRVHPAFSPRFALYEISTAKRRNTAYLVRKAIMPLFGDAARPCILRLCVNTTGIPFIWPLRQAAGGAGDSWAKSRFEVAQAAINGWVAIESGDGAYLIRYPERPDVFPEPRWPDGSANEWLHKGFPAELIIGEANHPAAQYRRGLTATL
jgi:hypothetical protein